MIALASPLDTLGLPVRVSNALERQAFYLGVDPTVGFLLDQCPVCLLDARGVGETAVDMIAETLADVGLHLTTCDAHDGHVVRL